MKAKEKSLESNGALDRDTASKKLSRLIEVADTLVSRGFVSIYEASYESIVNSLSVWEYQALDGSIQGPFTSQQIADWMSQGYFTGDSAVMIRRCGLAESHRPLISSGASESLATKRKQMDEYIGPTKKVKFDLGVQSTKEDLLADLDDDDDDGNDNDTDNNEVKAATKGTIEEEKGPWILSDDIDFRELASSSSSPYPSTELLSSATSSNTESYSSSSSEARKEALRRQMEEDADDDDDEDIDDDFEVNEGRTDSRHKRKPANKDDGDDSD